MATISEKDGNKFIRHWTTCVIFCDKCKSEVLSVDFNPHYFVMELITILIIILVEDKIDLSRLFCQYTVQDLF